MFLEAVVRPRSKLLEAPTGFGDTDHRRVEVTALDHCLQRGEDLFVGQIARGPEEDQGVRM
jgi:hypothetical protein